MSPDGLNAPGKVDAPEKSDIFRKVVMYYHSKATFDVLNWHRRHSMDCEMQRYGRQAMSLVESFA